MKLKPGINKIRIMPPAGMKWDYPHFRLIPIKESGTKVPCTGNTPGGHCSSCRVLQSSADSTASGA